MAAALQTRDRRSLIFLAVLFCHCLIIVALIRTGWAPAMPRPLADNPLFLLLLPRSPASASSPSSLGPRAALPRSTAAHTRVPKPLRRSMPPITLPKAPSKPSPAAIDWDHEAALEVDGSRVDADRDRNYRNLAGLTPERRAWLESHRMELAPPGMHWAHPRVEIVNGLPIIWINDHCVALPLMMLLVFCSIGHIERNGDLFEHMREADEARARSVVP